MVFVNTGIIPALNPEEYSTHAIVQNDLRNNYIRAGLGRLK